MQKKSGIISSISVFRLMKLFTYVFQNYSCARIDLEDMSALASKVTPSETTENVKISTSALDLLAKFITFQNPIYHLKPQNQFLILYV